jgi:chemotaxis protein histidine kinase CheA
VIQNIFIPGFSSKSTIGEFSGRGVGLDAVRDEAKKLGGNVRIFSEPGKGAKLILELPSARIEFDQARSA